MPDKYSCRVLVSGKTGDRRVRLTPAASVALAAWLDVHPNKNPESPVWINVQIRKDLQNKRLSYSWAHRMLKETAERVGINKPIRPHLMRHSLATYYAPRLTEAVMNEHFGWHQGGRTAAIYTHLSGKQVDDQILSVFGKKKIDPESSKAIDVLLCSRCGLENVPSSKQCCKCGYPLSQEKLAELIQYEDDLGKLAKAVLMRAKQNPKIVDMLLERDDCQPGTELYLRRLAGRKRETQGSQAGG